MIRLIRLKNFKTFIDESIELANQNIIIGNNASGKSNFIEAFKVIQDSFQHGMDNAYYLHGGFNSIFPRFSKSLRSTTGPKITAIEVVQVLNNARVLPARGSEKYVTWAERSKLVLSFSRNGQYDSQHFRYEVTYGVEEAADQKRSKYEYTVIIDTSKTLENVLSYRIDNEASSRVSEELHERDRGSIKVFIKRVKQDNDLSQLGFITDYFNIQNHFWSRLNIGDDLRFYDFNSLLVKSSTKLAGSEMNSDGSNYAYILRDILKSSLKKQEYELLVQKLMPSITSFSTKVTPDGQLAPIFRERNTKAISGHDMSDGVAYMLALLAVIVTTPPGKTLFFEEPDRYLHPGLARQLTTIVDDCASAGLQVLLTTHNQEFLKHSHIDSIRLVKRTSYGKSSIKNVQDSKEIARLLERGESIESLFVDRVLE